MEWLTARLLGTWLVLVLGIGLGSLAGARWGWPWVGALVGACAGVGALQLVDARRAYRVFRWLRGDREGDAPRAAGPWGEMAYRSERVIRHLEREIRAEREHLTQFLSAIEASPNGVLLLDPEDQIEWCNTMASVHLGLDAQRDRGQRVTNLVRAPGFVSYLQAGASEAGPVTLSMPQRDGTIAVLVRPYAKARRLILTQDVTERLRTDAMRRDFVANVSHEIRSPLTVLAGFVETMANLPLTEAERQRVLVLMKQQTDRMQTLVADLLTLAQLEGSPRPPLDHWLPVERIAQQVHADALALSKGRHTLGIDVPGHVAVSGNDNEWLSAVGNLVSNAVRYTPDGGRIDLRWRDHADGGGAIEVADTGIGIAREHLLRLTERFYRVDHSRSRETGGTGLGLAIAKHAVQRLGGELEIESEPGKGSCFRLVLPAVRVRRSASPADVPREHADAH